MPYRPEAELKRPDLKGEFLCGHCGKTFCHAASLNRHRLNFHGDDQQCQLCNQKISPHETVRRHMSLQHGISRVFTCGCCNWTFPDKKELHAHNNSMLRTGQPGDAKAIAVSSRPPGSLSQAELKGEERTIPSPSVTSSSKSPRSKKKAVDAPPSLSDMWNLISTAAGQSDGAQASIPANWLSALLLNNPSLLPILQKTDDDDDDDGDAANDDCVDEPGTSGLPMPLFANNNVNINNNNNNDDDEVDVKPDFSELNVRTESETTSSGPESGICSGEEYQPTECSPTPSDCSKEGTPTDSDAKSALPKVDNRKRKSVDAIASLLFKKKCQMK